MLSISLLEPDANLCKELRRQISSYFINTPHTLRTCGDAAKLLDRLSSESFHLIVADARQLLSGQEAQPVHKILDVLPGCRFIWLADSVQWLPRCFQTKMDGFLLKEDMGDLDAALSRSLSAIHRGAEEGLCIRRKGRMIAIPYQDILYLERVSRVIKVVTKQNSYALYYSLNEMEEALLPYGFFRCHYGFLINLAHVTELSYGAEYQVRMRNGAELPISRSRYIKTRKAFYTSHGDVFSK